MLVADMPLSARQVMMAARTAKARAQRMERSAYMADCAVEFRAYIRRRDLLRRSAAQKAAAAKATAGRNRAMLNNEAKRRATAFIIAMANWPVAPDDLMPVYYNQLCTTLRYVVAGDDTPAVTAR